MRLIGERLYLRPPDRGDIDLFLRWFNDPDVVRFLGRERPLLRPEEEEWFDGLAKRKDDMSFVIALRSDDRPIGCCGLHQIHPVSRFTTLGIAIGEKEHWSRGYGREAVNLLCGYGFDVLNLHRIALTVYDYNERGRRCYEKVGFRLEGRHREQRFWNGRYWDALAMGILAREWRALQKEESNGLKPESLSEAP